MRKHVRRQQQRGRQHQGRAAYGPARDGSGRTDCPGVCIRDLKLGVQDEHVVGQLINGRDQIRLGRRRRKRQHHQALTGGRWQGLQVCHGRLHAPEQTPGDDAAGIYIRERRENGMDTCGGGRAENQGQRRFDQGGRIGFRQTLTRSRIRQNNG